MNDVSVSCGDEIDWQVYDSKGAKAPDNIELFFADGSPLDGRPDTQTDIQTTPQHPGTAKVPNVQAPAGCNYTYYYSVAVADSAGNLYYADPRIIIGTGSGVRKCLCTLWDDAKTHRLHGEQLTAVEKELDTIGFDLLGNEFNVREACSRP